MHDDNYLREGRGRSRGSGLARRLTDPRLIWSWVLRSRCPDAASGSGRQLREIRAEEESNWRRSCGEFQDHAGSWTSCRNARRVRRRNSDGWCFAGWARAVARHRRCRPGDRCVRSLSGAQILGRRGTACGERRRRRRVCLDKNGILDGHFVSWSDLRDHPWASDTRAGRGRGCWSHPGPKKLIRLAERPRTTPLMRHGIDERAGLRIAAMANLNQRLRYSYRGYEEVPEQDVGLVE